ncbi:glycosyltransferase [Gillisia sp. CAL575]|uniref:glycosyltransferase n=1 Tax=Gillisia sp. CAL575 TaxID=985255 RepID=UPI0003A17216|nr:glycosyltransferase [Gillisia sp. CAL575]
MKILQLIHKIQNRGAETFTCQLSNHLIKLGHEVKIVALYNGSATLPFKGEIEILNNTKSNRFLDLKHWKKLANIISNFQPDLVQANAGDTLKYAVFSKKVFKWKQPIVFRNASEVGRYLKSPLQKGLNKLLYKNVDWVVSVSQASRKDLISHFPFLNGRVDVVGVGLDSFELQSPKVLKPVEKKHIIHIGGFSFEKNHQGLLDIFELLSKERNDIHLHLIGDGPLKADVELLAAQRNLLDKITFYGFVNDPLSYLQSGDILVLPSIIEGLPGVILEAMLCKTPVVAFNVGGISEVLNTATGSLIIPGDNTSFVNAIIETLKQPNSDQLEKAYSLVTTEFMNAQLALNFVNSYQKLVPIL